MSWKFLSRQSWVLFFKSQPQDFDVSKYLSNFLILLLNNSLLQPDIQETNMLKLKYNNTLNCWMFFIPRVLHTY